MCVESGIEPHEVWGLTFREIDWKLRLTRSRLDHDWSQTRLVVSALTGKSPKSIIRLSNEVQDKIDWTPELANEVIKKFGWQKLDQ